MRKIRRLIPLARKLPVVLLALSLLGFGLNYEVLAQSDQLVCEFPLITNLCQLRQTVKDDIGSICAFSLEETVLAVNPGEGTLFLQDDTGTEIVETKVIGPEVQPGQRIRLRGTNYVALTATGVSLGKCAVVENDGRHGKSECTATVWLKAGRYPIQVLWFNYTRESLLELDYSGPNLPRRRIPDTSLFRRESSPPDGQKHLVNGLDYRCFEGVWPKLPPFETLIPVKTGVVTNFSLAVKTRDEYVGLVFDGFIRTDSDGLYTFYVTSDDGSQLFLKFPPAQLIVIGLGNVPAPEKMMIRQPLPARHGSIWAEAEGTVTFLGGQPDGNEMELTSDDSHMRVAIGNELQPLPRYLLGSRVKVVGACLDTSNLEGYRMADKLVIPSWKNLQVTATTRDFWPVTKTVNVGECKHIHATDESGIVRLQGKIRSRASGQYLTDNSGSIPIELLNAAPAPTNDEVECLGEWSLIGSNSIIREALWRELPAGTDVKPDSLPLLTTAAEVQQLTREQAGRGYKARIQGVVTWVSEKRDNAILQDRSARGVFVGLRENWIWDSPNVGEILAVEGDCIAGDFSPIIILTRGKKLGRGLMPAPKRPSWDQLIRGSMDSQYVEIRGLVTETHDDHLILLISGGKVDVELDFNPPDSLDSLVDSVIRIQGCLFAKWDQSLLVTPEHPLRFGSATICVDTPAPLDPFDGRKMRGKELMQFDARGNVFQRVKVSGQILGDSAGTYFLTDDGFGLRFQPVKEVEITPGDQVEVVGLVELGGASPILREAVFRRTGHSPLPQPAPFAFEGANTVHDSSRVWVEAVLQDATVNGSECVLQMQSGLRTFVARMPSAEIHSIPWAFGSRLKLTGVFAELESGQPGTIGMKPFELLLNSPADIEIMARPPWWTLSRLLTIVTVLVAGLVLAFIWINLLQRQVEWRTVQLKHEVNERQRAEQDRVIERERSRIAQDLHDDLGGSLTAISMLAITGVRAKLTPEASQDRLQMIVDRSRSMVTALDELVWAVNPKNDTVTALAEYLASFAEELLATTQIVCRVELPLEFPHQIMVAESRHNVLLSVKEAITNAVRHGQPTEILLQLTLQNGGIEILIKDNGVGFDPARHPPGNGLANLQERMHKINGQCRIQSSPGQGTMVFLAIPL